MTEDKKVLLHVWVPESLKGDLESIAKDKGTTVSDITRMTLVQMVKKEKRKK